MDQLVEEKKSECCSKYIITFIIFRLLIFKIPKRSKTNVRASAEVDSAAPRSGSSGDAEPSEFSKTNKS